MALAGRFDLPWETGPTPAPSDAVVGAEPDGGVRRVRTDRSPDGHESRSVLEREPDAGSARHLSLDEVLDEGPLRDALAHVESGVRRVFVGCRLPAVANDGPPAGVDRGTVAVDGDTSAITVHSE